MILSERYNTTVTQGDLQATAKIPDIPIDTAEFSPAYWLGWMQVEKIPQVFNVGRIVLTDSTVVFETLTDTTVNRDIYMECSTDVQDNAAVYDRFDGNYYDGTENVEKWTCSGTLGTNHNRLVNELHYQQYGFSSISVTFCIKIWNTNINGWGYVTRALTMPINDWLGFIGGNDLTVNFPMHGDEDISIDMFDSNGFARIGDGETDVLFISEYSFNQLKNAYGYPQYGKIVMGVHVPFVYQDNAYDGTIISEIGRINYFHFNVSGDNIVDNETYYWMCSSTDRTTTSPYCNNGAHGVFDRDNLPNGRGVNDRYWIINGNVVLQYEERYTEIFVAFHPMGIMHHAALYRWEITESDTATPGYSIGNIYYPKIDLATNEFLGELITGTETVIKPQLPTWMKYEISENTYTEDDKPVPTEPDTDSDGDNISPHDFTNQQVGNANNFVTLYAMSADNVEKFGRMLWAALSDPNYWHLIGTVFTSDFSINPADILSYINFLRYYPFNLGLSGTGGAETGIYIGRATTPILPGSVGNLPKKISHNLIVLDGGTLDVPTLYGDFRDYEPCSDITLYIPFCGSAKLCPSEIVGKTLTLKYYVDLQTGALKAITTLASDTSYIVASLAGTCGASIQITSNNNIEFLQRIATVAAGAITGTTGAESITETIAAGAVSGVGAMSGLPSVAVHSSGNSTGFANLAGCDTAYITIQYQKYIVPDNYGHTTGYAVQFSDDIKNLSGYVLCENVDTTGLTCSEDERTAIKQLLERGIYV